MKLSQEVCEKIAEAERSGAISLDLSLCSLREVPEEVLRLSHLKELNLCSNLLSSLPANIGDLANLTELLLGNNLLTDLPELGKLRQPHQA
jgi:Leucine-rich repeat (LRR) protein